MWISKKDFERIKTCESKLQAVCDYLSIKIEPAKHEWQIRSKDEIQVKTQTQF